MSRFLIPLLVTLIFSACNKPTPPGQSIAQIPLTSLIGTLDPANSYDAVSGEVVYQVYEQLYEYHYLKRPLTLQPLLARQLPRIDQGGTRYTITIKRNIQYHEDPAFKGQARTLKAMDFIHQIKRIALTKTQSNGWFLFNNMIVGLDEFRRQAKDHSDILHRDVYGLQAVGDYTLVIKLTRPYPQLPYVLAMSFTSPVPYEAIVHYQNNLGEHPVGTGPFQLVRWNRGLDLVLEKNPHYRRALYPAQGESGDLLADANKPIPFVDQIKFKIIKEGQARWLNFLSQKIDFLPIPKDNFNMAITPEGKLSPLLKGKNVALQINPTLTYWWLAFNMHDPHLGKNHKLRQAIAHAIDIKRYIKLFTNNTGKQANSIFIPEVPGYHPNAKVNFAFDLKQAHLLMTQAGHAKGKGLPRFTYDIRGHSTQGRQQGEYIKSALEKIGIKIDIVTNTFPGFLEKLRQGKMQIWIDGWTLDYPDAENITQLLYSKAHPPGPNHCFYHNQQVDKLIEQLKVLPNGPKKFSLMQRIEAYVAQDLPWVILYYRRDYLLYQKRLKNFKKSDAVSNYLKYVRLAP